MLPFGAMSVADGLRALDDGECLEVRGVLTDYFVRVVPDVRTTVLELARNRYQRRGRDAWLSTRRRSQAETVGLRPPNRTTTDDAVASMRCPNDVGEIARRVEQVLALFDDEPYEVGPADTAHRRSGWPDVPFCLIWWDARRRPRFDLMAQGVRRLEAVGCARVHFIEIDASASTDYAFLLAGVPFECDEAEQLFAEICAELRADNGSDVFHRC